MRILHVIPGLAYSSGPTHVVLHLAERLADRGHKVSIYYLTGRGYDTVFPRNSSVEMRGFPVKIFKKWGYAPSLHRHLDQTVSQFDIIHIHSLWSYPNIAATQAAWRHGIPYLMRPIGSLEPWCMLTSRCKKRIYMALIERRHLKRAAAIHATSEQEALNIAKLGIGTKIVVVPNGINPDEYNVMPPREVFRERFNIGTNKKVVLFLGRLHPKKGLNILVESFAQVYRVTPNVILGIVGPDEGGYVNMIKSQVERLGITNAVIFAGELKGQDKLAAYAAADVFVLPSHSENFGIVVAEAMASGLPVVVSRNTPWQDVERQNAGLWVNLKVEEISQAILTILNNQRTALKMGQNGRMLVRDKYSWYKITKQMLKVYENILAGRDPDFGLAV